MNTLCHFIGLAYLFTLVAIWVVNLEAFAVTGVARHVVARDQRVSLTHGHNTLQHGTASRSFDIFVSANGSDLIRASLVMSKRPESLSVSLGTLNILSFQVSNAGNGIW